METQVRDWNAVKMRSLLVLGVMVTMGFFASVTLGQDYAYVTNAGEWAEGVKGDLSVIDLATNTVIATVPVGGYPQGVAINPAGTAVYTANSSSNEFSVIDTFGFKTTTLAAGLGACGVAVHPNGRHIYVANPDWDQKGESNVMVIDRATNEIIDRIDCGKGSCLVVVHPDGGSAYVTNVWDGTVAVFDTATHNVIDTIVLKPIGADEVCFPVPIVIHPEGSYVYAANRLGSTVWMINTATHEVVTASSGYAHVGLAIDPAGTVLYVPDLNDVDLSIPAVATTVDVLDAKTLQRITTIEGLNLPLDVSVHPDGTRAYVTNLGNNTVSVVDTATCAVIAAVSVGSHPHGCGDFIGPGVPRLLIEDAVTRLQAVKTAIAEGTEGVNSPQKAIEHITVALTSLNASLQENLWAAASPGIIDPRRLPRAQGAAVFASGQATVEAMLNAIRRGWIVNTKLNAELLAVADEIARASRVLAAVAIDDAIMAKANVADLDTAQQILEQADALAREARVWQQPDKKAPLLRDAIDRYRHAWEAAVRLVQ